MPAPKRADGMREVDPDTAETKHVEDTRGGWSLTENEQIAAKQLEEAKRISSGDYTKEVEGDRAATKAEERRVEAAASPEPAKPAKSPFLRGGKEGKSGKTPKKT